MSSHKICSLTTLVSWKIELERENTINIVSSNVRDAGNTIRIWLFVRKPVNSNKTCKILKRINLSNFIEIPLEDFSERTWLMWKYNVEVTLIFKTHNRFIHYLYRDSEKIFFGWVHLYSHICNIICKNSSGMKPRIWINFLYTLDDYWKLDELATSKEEFANNKGKSTRYDKFKNN